MMAQRAVASRVLGSVLAALAVATAMGATPASAFTLSDQRCFGATQIPVTNAYAGSGTFLQIQFPARAIYRAACYGTSTQVISIRYRVWRQDGSGSWVYFTGQQFTTSVAPGYYTIIPSWSNSSTNRNLSADILVEWRTTSGYLIGSRYINLNAVTDYTCSGCFVRTDPVMGAKITLGW